MGLTLNTHFPAFVYYQGRSQGGRGAPLPPDHRWPKAIWALGPAGLPEVYKKLSPVHLESFSDTINNSIFLKFSAYRQAFCCSLDIVSSNVRITLRPYQQLYFLKFSA